MNNDNKVETAIAGLNCWVSYATVQDYAYFLYREDKRKDYIKISLRGDFARA